MMLGDLIGGSYGVASTAETFCVSGRTVQWIMRHFKNRRSRNIEQSLWRAIGG